jgi:hypothetical protein
MIFLPNGPAKKRRRMKMQQVSEERDIERKVLVVFL